MGVCFLDACTNRGGFHLADGWDSAQQVIAMIERQHVEGMRWPMRSWMYAPGDDKRKLRRAAESNADVVIVDLEDSVADARKAAGRRNAITALSEHDFGRSRRFVRVNSDSPEQDIIAVAPGNPDGFVLPKASSPEQVESLLGVLADMPVKKDVALIVTETAKGVLAMNETMAAGRESCVAVMWGTEDLGAAMGMPQIDESDGRVSDPFITVRSLFLLTAKANGFPAIDRPFVDLTDDDGLERESRMSYLHGFAGKQSIHPRQVGIINRAFTPSSAEVERARRLLAAFAENESSGVLTFGGKMVDRPHLEQARRLIARAQILDDLE